MDEAEIIRNGKNQSISLPQGYRFKGDRVYVKKVGNAVLLIPEENPWQSLVSSLDQFTEDFMTERDQPTIESRSEMFE